MKVLVADANGAIGIPLSRAPVASGHEVIGLSRTSRNRGRLHVLTPSLPAVPGLVVWWLAPYAYTVMSGTLHVSNERARRELGWMPTRQQSIATALHPGASGVAADGVGG